MSIEKWILVTRQHSLTHTNCGSYGKLTSFQKILAGYYFIGTHCILSPCFNSSIHPVSVSMFRRQGKQFSFILHFLTFPCCRENIFLVHLLSFNYSFLSSYLNTNLFLCHVFILVAVFFFIIPRPPSSCFLVFYFLNSIFIFVFFPSLLQILSFLSPHTKY